MGNKVVVGIDVGKESYAVSVFDGRAYLFQGLTPAHPETFLKRVIPHLPQDAAEVLFVMEATGIYSLKLALFLVQGGHRVSVVNPFVVRKYAEMRLRRTKTDPADSRILESAGSVLVRRRRISAYFLTTKGFTTLTRCPPWTRNSASFRE